MSTPAFLDSLFGSLLISRHSLSLQDPPLQETIEEHRNVLQLLNHNWVASKLLPKIVLLFRIGQYPNTACRTCTYIL
jgi:hypothetical protein